MTRSLYLVVVEGLDDTQDVPVVGFEVGLNLCQAPRYKLNQEQPTRLHLGQSEQSIVEFQISIWNLEVRSTVLQGLHRKLILQSRVPDIYSTNFFTKTE